MDRAATSSSPGGCPDQGQPHGCWGVAAARGTLGWGGTRWLCPWGGELFLSVFVLSQISCLQPVTCDPAGAVFPPVR